MDGKRKNQLQVIREQRSLSRPRLGELVGVSFETIKAYEVKGATPSLKVAVKIAEVLETTVENLFEFDEE